MSTMHKLRKKEYNLHIHQIWEFAGGIVNKAKYIKKPIERDIERGRFMIWPPLGIVYPQWLKVGQEVILFMSSSPQLMGSILLWPNINTMPLYCELSNSHMFTLESSFAKKIGILIWVEKINLKRCTKYNTKV